MRILYNNLINSGSSWTSYSVDPNYPLTNIYDTRLSREYRTLSVSTTEYIIIQQSSIAPTYVSLINHNISSAALIYIEASSSSGFGGCYSTTIPWSSYLMLTNFTSTAKDFWRVRIEGNSTAIGYIKIGYLYLGTYLQLPWMKNDQELLRYTTAKSVVGDGGQLYGDDGYNYRMPKINFPFLTNQERLDISTMFNTVKNYKPVIMHIWANSTEETPMYCYINQDNLSFKRTDDVIMRWATSLSFREVF